MSFEILFSAFLGAIAGALIARKQASTTERSYERQKAIKLLLNANTAISFRSDLLRALTESEYSFADSDTVDLFLKGIPSDYSNYSDTIRQIAKSDPNNLQVQIFRCHQTLQLSALPQVGMKISGGKFDPHDASEPFWDFIIQKLEYQSSESVWLASGMLIFNSQYLSVGSIRELTDLQAKFEKCGWRDLSWAENTQQHIDNFFKLQKILTAKMPG